MKRVDFGERTSDDRAPGNRLALVVVSVLVVGVNLLIWLPMVIDPEYDWPRDQIEAWSGLAVIAIAVTIAVVAMGRRWLDRWRG